MQQNPRSKATRIALYGGTFDPPHRGHLQIARRITHLFDLDRFLFVPAYHAPHKTTSSTAGPYHRFAMLCLATENMPRVCVSDIELRTQEKRYTFDTLAEFRRNNPDVSIFFVMGADSWQEINTWYRWDELLKMTNFIVVSRPGFPIGSEHITDYLRERIVDLRRKSETTIRKTIRKSAPSAAYIFLTDAVSIKAAATRVREDIRVDGRLDNPALLPPKVAKYIEKYDLYK